MTGRRSITRAAAAACLGGLLVFACATARAQQEGTGTTVRKTAEAFNGGVSWQVAEDSTADGTASLEIHLRTQQAAPPTATGHNVAMVAEAKFSGRGFEVFKAAPATPYYIPGRTKRVSLWVRTPTKQAWTLSFRDGWGRTEVAGRKLEWQITRGGEDAWKQVTFDVPGDWVQPLAFDGVVTHNWESRGEKATARLLLDQIEVEYDLADADPATGALKTWQAPPAGAPGVNAQNPPRAAPTSPLRSVTVYATRLLWANPHNVFSGLPPRFSLQARDWRPGSAARGAVTWTVRDTGDAVVARGKQAMEPGAEPFAAAIAPDTRKFGVYRFEYAVSWDGEPQTPAASRSLSYAVIPEPHRLSDADKDASPYGLNVHSGRMPMVETFARAGIVWFRDYAFTYDWVLQSKGDDNKYAAWPHFTNIVRRYQDSGVRLLPVFQKSIRPPGGSGGAAPGPDRAWTREMTSFLMAFPSLTHFELDNEYDLHGGNAKAEEAIGWKNYGAYHRKFGEIAQLLSDGQFTIVENGRAGIWPERVRRIVGSGDFAAIDVVNSHHYTGIDPPETNVGNHNMGFSGDESVLSFYDQLRAAKQAASSDGRPRQHWLTEFGWDTKAGPVVTPAEQAAYLARAYMLLAAAGTEKGFWFFDLDSPSANNFFDGCGLFTHDQMPKPAFAAYAGLTQVLPRPRFVGAINAGPGTWGYLFRNDGKLVAALWTLDGKGKPGSTTVDFGPGATLYDAFANPLPAGKTSAPLGIAPVYAVGVAEDGRWARQAAYHVESPLLVSVTSGDAVEVTLRVTNRQSSAIDGTARLVVPAGWTALTPEVPVAVAPGQSATVALRYRVGADEPLGEKPVGIAIRERDGLTHAIPLRARIERPVVLTVGSLTGEPGEADVAIRVGNRSAKAIDGTLTLKLPGAWSTPTPTIAVNDLKPMEVRDVSARVRWTGAWNPGESADVSYRSADGARTARQPIIPGRLTVYRAPSGLVADGSLKDWPAKTRVPAWTLGATAGEPNADVYLAWSEAGLHVALDVRDAKTSVPDPRTFWNGDVLELFVDTGDRKTRRRYEVGDHQFWLAPLVGEKRAYVGRWKRAAEIPETLYDVAGVRSAVASRPNGYTLEGLIPAALLQGYKPAPGARLGLALSLSVKGHRQDREAFWPVPKSEGAEQPAAWGTVTLGQ